MSVLHWVQIVLWATGLNAQTCLVLSPMTIQSDGTASWTLSLNTAIGSIPAALQWTLDLTPSSGISSLKIDDGPALMSTGKTATCAGNTGTFSCVAAGSNRNTITNGIVAQLTAVLSPGETTAIVQVREALGVSVDGYLIRVYPIVGLYSSGCTIRPPHKP
jgi:hypothetical protein